MGRNEAPRAAVIGYGLAGSVFHAPLLSSTGFEVTVIVTANPARRATAQRDFPHARILSSVDEVWSKADEYDLVVVAS